MITMTTGKPGEGMTLSNLMHVIYKANPTLERIDLHNGHVIDWKWFLQETRGFNWIYIRHVSWLDGYGSFA